jgi:hypothetical protein
MKRHADPERRKDLARGRALGTPWRPDEDGVNRPPAQKPPPGDERCEPPDEPLVSEDEEGMVGHPEPD